MARYKVQFKPDKSVVIRAEMKTAGQLLFNETVVVPPDGDATAAIVELGEKVKAKRQAIRRPAIGQV